MSLPNSFGSKFRLEQNVFFVFENTHKRTEVQCPDCLGKCCWEARSPRGDCYSVDCPRCNGHGSKSVVQPLVEVKSFTVRHIKTVASTDPESSGLFYSSESYGNGYVKRESELFESEGEAENAASKKRDEFNSKNLEGIADHSHRMFLLQHSFIDDVKKQLEDRTRTAEFRLDRLRRRVFGLIDTLDLSDDSDDSVFISAGGEFSSSCFLTKDQAFAVQEEIVWLDDKLSRELIDYREEKADEDGCQC